MAQVRKKRAPATSTLHQRGFDAGFAGNPIPPRKHLVLLHPEWKPEGLEGYITGWRKGLKRRESMGE